MAKTAENGLYRNKSGEVESQTLCQKFPNIALRHFSLDQWWISLQTFPSQDEQVLQYLSMCVFSRLHNLSTLPYSQWVGLIVHLGQMRLELEFVHLSLKLINWLCLIKSFFLQIEIQITVFDVENVSTEQLEKIHFSESINTFFWFDKKEI